MRALPITSVAIAICFAVAPVWPNPRAWGQDTMATADTMPSLAEIQAIATEAVDATVRAKGIELDYSPGSIRNVDAILTEISASDLDETEKRALAIDFGFYLGEVFRRNYGAEWVIDPSVAPELMRGIGLMARRGEWFNPVARTLRRVKNGVEDDLVGYTVALMGVQVPPALPPRRDDK